MHFFFREGIPLKTGAKIALAEEDINHAFRVLRLNPGEEVVIADGRGLAMRGQVAAVSAREILVDLKAGEQLYEPPLKIILCPALLKGDKMDLVIRQAVELGVYRIAPLVSARSIVQPARGCYENRLKRWQAIARSSAAQCRRAFLPRVEPLRNLAELIEEARLALIVVPWEEERSQPLAALELKEPHKFNQGLFLLIGPEGGFEAQEVEELKRGGAVIVSLGPRIMRSDTAAAAALTLIQASWGDLARKAGRL